MISFKSKLLNATLAVTAAIPLATAGFFTSAGSAQAVTLNGSIALNGTSVIPSDGTNPVSTSIKFTNVNGVTASGDFLAFSPNLGTTPITINTLNLTKITDLPSTLISTSATYSTGTYTPFINFGSQTLNGITAPLTFNLDNSVVTRSQFAYGISDITNSGILGEFNFNGQTIAAGFLNASLSGVTSSYQLTLTTLPVNVPEPAALLGLGAVGAVMAMSRRRKSFAQ